MLPDRAVPPLRILIIESDALIALYLDAIVSDAGHKVVGIRSCLRADDLVSASAPQPDLALVEVEHPDHVHGFDAARTIRDRYGIPAVFLTVQPSDPAVQAGVAEYGDAMLVGKVSAIHDLVPAIDLLMRQRTSAT